MLSHFVGLVMRRLKWLSVSTFISTKVNIFIPIGSLSVQNQIMTNSLCQIPTLPLSKLKNTNLPHCALNYFGMKKHTFYIRFTAVQINN